MSEIDETDDELSCSFCKERFSDVIKLIPECYNNICGKCYEDLKQDVDDESKQYKCMACKEMHLLPSSGLRDNKALMIALNKIKSTEKPLHPNAKRLKELLTEIEAKMRELRSFDGKQVIEIECEQLEQKLKDAVESAVDHLKEIETKMMKEISEYRERCLANHRFKKISQAENATKCELDALMKEVGGFNAKWNDYFGRIGVYATENEIEDALFQTALYVSTIESMEVRMRKEALNWQKMVFDVNEQFLKEWEHVGEIEIIDDIKATLDKTEEYKRKEKPLKLLRYLNSLEPPNQRGETADSLNPLNSTTPQKMTIQQTPSFTLTGHSYSVLQVLFLPDGRLASCSSDKTIKIWNVENGKELFQLTGHTREVCSIALLPNGHLASGSSDATIKVWDLEQRKVIRTIQAHSYWVISLRVLKNGNLASYSYDQSIKIWNLNSEENKPVLTSMSMHGNASCGTLVFGILSNDYFVACSRHKESKEECILRVWNQNQLNPFKLVPTGFRDAFSLLVLSNDQVALGFEKSGTIKIIDLNDSALSRTKERAHDKDVSSLAQLSNGNLVSAGKDGLNWTIKVWNLIDWSLLQTINTGHSYSIQSLCISGDERFLASGSRDKTIKMWPISIE